MKYFDIKDPGEDLPSVSNSNRRVSIDNNMSDLVKKLDGVIDSNIELYKVNQFEQNNFTFDTHKVDLINVFFFINFTKDYEYYRNFVYAVVQLYLII